MSGADVTGLLGANMGQISGLLTSSNTLWANRGYETFNLFAVDNTQAAGPTSAPQSFGLQDTFKIRKRGGRVHRTWLRLTISSSTVAATENAAYVDDLGAGIIAKASLQYASKTLQEYNGEALKMYKRLTKHDINREHYFAQALAGLPPGPFGAPASAPEYRRTGASTVAGAPQTGFLNTGGILLVPLDWLWFTRATDYALTPEALASELDLVVTYNTLANLVYARTIATGAISAAPFTVAPTITKSELCTQMVHTSVPEKNLNLSSYETRQGQLYKILDFEPQLNLAMAASTNTQDIYTYRLDNLRLDSHMIMFMVRDARITTPYALDRMQSDTTPSVLAPGGVVVAALQPIVQFRLIANGKTIVDYCSDLENRSVWRHIYFPDTQVAEAIYFIPFGWFLKEHKNASGFQNLANLGSVELEITMPGSANTTFPRSGASLVDVYSVAHNIVQQKDGDIIKLLR